MIIEVQVINLLNSILTHYFHIQESIVDFLIFFHTFTYTTAISTMGVVKQEAQQLATPKDAERTDFTPIRPQPPLLNQQNNTKKS